MPTPDPSTHVFPMFRASTTAEKAQSGNNRPQNAIFGGIDSRVSHAGRGRLLYVAWEPSGHAQHGTLYAPESHESLSLRTWRTVCVVLLVEVPDKRRGGLRLEQLQGYNFPAIVSSVPTSPGSRQLPEPLTAFTLYEEQL